MAHQHTTMNAFHINAIICNALVRWFTQPSHSGIQSDSIRFEMCQRRKSITIRFPLWTVFRSQICTYFEGITWTRRHPNASPPYLLSSQNTHSLNCAQPAKKLSAPMIDKINTHSGVVVTCDRSLACFIWPTLPCPTHSIWVLMLRKHRDACFHSHLSKSRHNVCELHLTHLRISVK